ncbi:DNA (cytosine-5)-methyltransferase 1 [Methylorubrum rhodinum]|uniref:Cytosine-specific methyltransferase n=1 Tax=Methylorubrum rhodinum TaxID=29428 RepID=A0A840ZMI9_9HYPH|nr:DNA (cytosine-5-)-methyltransferase [Methylorubrum rhodinum]MBB5758806.1 DNA (cytosine-5)-methyltransferase 1 [Methylorubrum rhodinum]
MSEPLHVLDLFSGIGGFSLGLERTGGFRTVAFCEIDPFCRRVLAKHWPEVPCYDDIRTLTADRLRADGIAVDVICGGFPCQDISNGGHRVGIGGERSGLWSEIARLSGELRPDFIILENVAALLGRGLGRVLGDLAALWYDAEWHCLSASDLGAPHERDRIWIVAYPETLRRDEGQWGAEGWGRLLWAGIHDSPSAWSSAANNHEVRSGLVRIVHGLPDHVDRLGVLGNAVVPQIPEMIGRAILASRAPCIAEAAP